MPNKKLMLIKKFTILLAILTTIALSTAHVYAYINHNTNEPDIWLNPGYQWNVSSDTIGGQSVCLQWSTDSGANWDRARCQAVGGDAWECQIANNLPGQTVTYQFYKDVWDDDCAVTGNEWEWTFQNDFTTGPTAVSLQTISATNQHTGLILTAIAILLLISGLDF